MLKHKKLLYAISDVFFCGGVASFCLPIQLSQGLIVRFFLSKQTSSLSPRFVPIHGRNKGQYLLGLIFPFFQTFRI